MTSSAGRSDCSGLVPTASRAAPACIAITLMLCATTSCSSRAIRSRSAATACRASSLRASSSSLARWAFSAARVCHRRAKTPKNQDPATRPAKSRTESHPGNLEPNAEEQDEGRLDHRQQHRGRPQREPDTDAVGNEEDRRTQHEHRQPEHQSIDPGSAQQHDDRSDRRQPAQRNARAMQRGDGVGGERKPGGAAPMTSAVSAMAA